MNVQMHDPVTSPQPFVSQASFSMPELMAQSAWIEHAPFGFWIVDALRPRTVVELGVHRGFSYFVFCQAVRQLRLDARCLAIDSWAGDQHAGYYGEDVYRQVATHNRRYDDISRLVRADFAEALNEFADGSIDLLHIDGCHTYEAVRRDFEMWLPKLSRRGVVLFHDTAEYERGFGVYLLWEQLRTRYPHFEFTHGHGLGVIAVGAEPPAQIRRLLHASATPASAQTVRALYERLGAFVSHEQKLQDVVDSYEASTSWRVTRPLRALARLMASARGAADDVGANIRAGSEPYRRPCTRNPLG